MTTTHRKTATAWARHINGSIAGRDSARAMARAIEALPVQNDYTRDEVARLWAFYAEMERDIDDVCAQAGDDGYSMEQIDRACHVVTA